MPRKVYYGYAGLRQVLLEGAISCLKSEDRAYSGRATLLNNLFWLGKFG